MTIDNVFDLTPHPTKKANIEQFHDESVVMFLEACDLVEKIRRDVNALVQEIGLCDPLTSSAAVLIDSAGGLSDTVSILIRELHVIHKEGVHWKQTQEQIRYRLLEENKG